MILLPSRLIFLPSPLSISRSQRGAKRLSKVRPSALGGGGAPPSAESLGLGDSWTANPAAFVGKLGGCNRTSTNVTGGAGGTGREREGWLTRVGMEVWGRDKPSGSKELSDEEL